MTEKQTKELSKLWNKMSDKNRFEFLRDNQDLGLIVELGDRETIVKHTDNDLQLNFDVCIGTSYGILILFEVLKINNIFKNGE